MNEQEMKMEAALDRYFEHFGKNYPLCISMPCPSPEELIRSVEECIANDKPMEEPVYEQDCDY